jgi:hypothetical protein
MSSINPFQPTLLQKFIIEAQRADYDERNNNMGLLSTTNVFDTINGFSTGTYNNGNWLQLLNENEGWYTIA